MTLQLLHSKLDASVNFVTKAPVGYFESRYVKRPESPYFICYVSSQSGCAQNCQMCHLTTTGQKKFVNATGDDLWQQVHPVLTHRRRQPGAPAFAHLNFMARGEPLANPHIHDYTLNSLCSSMASHGVSTRVNISTIMPRRMHASLRERFMYTRPVIYYSLYSTRPEFRKKWLPSAMAPQYAMEELAAYTQLWGTSSIKIHYAFIEGENDSDEDVQSVIDLMHGFGMLGCSINIVRYNPPDVSSRETSEERIEEIRAYLSENLIGRVKVIPRVGLDVKASCGTFLTDEDLCHTDRSSVEPA